LTNIGKVNGHGLNDELVIGWLTTSGIRNKRRYMKFAIFQFHPNLKPYFGLDDLNKALLILPLDLAMPIGPKICCIFKMQIEAGKANILN
jgi:hypothetical protein